MRWFSIYNIVYPKERCLWVKVRILHETDKAILVKTTAKVWIPKSRILKIRLRKNRFEVYVRESAIV